MPNAALNRWIIDSATDFAIIATDRDGRVTTWNEGARQILGWTEEEMLGQPVDRFFTPEDVANGRPATEMRCALETGAGNDERWHQRKSGERFWANGQMTVLRDDDGKAVGFVKVLRDRTEQRLATETLRGNQHNIRLLLDSMAEGFYAVDREGVTTVCNAAFLRMLSFDREEDAVGRKLHDVIHGRHPDGSHYDVHDCPIYQCAREGTSAHVTDELFFPLNGEPLPVEYWAIPIHSGGELQGAICTFLDVTDRRRADEARRASEEQLRLLNADLERQVLSRSLDRGMTWQVSPDLLAVINSEGVFESANPSWQAVLGWGEEELRGMRALDLIHPDDILAGKEGLSTLSEGRPLLGFENRQRHRDGSYRWLSWVAVPEGDRIYTRARDITGERLQTEALEHAQDALRQSQKLEAVGQLTGGVAHDFNNLLTVIRGSVDLLRRPGLTEERRVRYTDAIAATADRAAKLTGQLLAFARRQALKPELFDVGANLKAVREMVGTLAGSRISIDLSLPEQPCYIHADPSQFDTTIVNMAVNGRDAMDGEGRLEIAVEMVTQMPSVRSHPPVDGDFVTVAVRDTGHGITPENLVRIFEPFFTTKDVGQGTGLGLSQVFGFAKQSGGEVLVESEVGQGTTFTLYLPAASAGEERLQAVPDQDDFGGCDGTCVLVVEDNADVGRFATATLAELGYSTVYAENAAAALAELEEDAERFDIVFSDVIMPGMNGLDMAKLIRKRYPELPVVLTSGYSHVLAEQGSDGFELLHKPYSMDQVARVLRKMARPRTAG